MEENIGKGRKREKIGEKLRENGEKRNKESKQLIINLLHDRYETKKLR